jgi:hypothetical protein
LAAELDEFINQYMRGHNVWLSCIHQELNQIDEHLRNTLLSLGTYIIGGTSSMDSARLLADALFLRDSSRVKHWRKVWMSGGSINGRPLAPYVVDVEPEFMNLEEQKELFAQRVKRLGLFQFLVRPALSEGLIGTAVYPLSIDHVDRDPITGQGAFPEQHVLARIRSILAARSGKPQPALLAEQETRLAHITPAAAAGRYTRQLGQEHNPRDETPPTEPKHPRSGQPKRHRERVD